MQVECQGSRGIKFYIPNRSSTPSIERKTPRHRYEVAKGHVDRHRPIHNKNNKEKGKRCGVTSDRISYSNGNVTIQLHLEM